MTALDILPLTKTLNVLYAEDDKELREATAGLFMQLFADVDVVSDGQEALDIFEKGKYDIFITDILMPHVTGLECAKTIKDKDPNQHIIFISAYNDAQYFETSIELGIDGYIVKPLNHSQLLETLFKIATKIVEHKENLAYKTHLKEQVQARTLEFKESLITDTLTKLPNRMAVEHDLEFEVAQDLTVSAVLFNIDNFSSVNIGFGYDVGDALLLEVAAYLKANLPTSMKLYRIGSDEFLAISNQMDIQQLKDIVEDLQSRFIHTILELPHNLKLSFSMTAAIAHAQSDKLIRSVHLALHEAKKVGKNQLYTYHDNLTIESHQKDRIQWINKVRLALEHDLFVPFFQPIILNSSGKIEKYECLARIVENDKIITPNYFIEPARMSGQMSELTKVMIRKAMEVFSHFDCEFSINIEAEDLNANYLPDYIKHNAQKYHIKMNRIVIEVLENIPTYDVGSTLKQLIDLKEMGIKIAIDDFGNEQSNFSRLLDIQADYIKIDGQFIKSIDTDPKSYKIASAITNLAKSLDTKVIAEFVHSPKVLDKILELGIDFSQGYHFGAPAKEVRI